MPCIREPMVPAPGPSVLALTRNAVRVGRRFDEGLTGEPAQRVRTQRQRRDGRPGVQDGHRRRFRGSARGCFPRVSCSRGLGLVERVRRGVDDQPDRRRTDFGRRHREGMLGEQRCAVLGGEPAGKPQAAVGLPAGAERRGGGLLEDLPVATGPSDPRAHPVQLTGRARQRRVHQLGLVLGRGDPGQGADLRVREPARGERRPHHRQGLHGAGDSQLLAGRPGRQAAAPRQPWRARPQPGTAPAPARVEHGQQRQEPARARRKMPGERGDLTLHRRHGQVANIISHGRTLRPTYDKTPVTQRLSTPMAGRRHRTSEGGRSSRRTRARGRGREPPVRDSGIRPSARAGRPRRRRAGRTSRPRRAARRACRAARPGRSRRRAPRPRPPPSTGGGRS